MGERTKYDMNVAPQIYWNGCARTKNVYGPTKKKKNRLRIDDFDENEIQLGNVTNEMNSIQ